MLEDDHAGERLTQVTRHTEDSSQACGQPFCVEIEMLDRWANPCSTASVLALRRADADGASDAGERECIGAVRRFLPLFPTS